MSVDKPKVLVISSCPLSMGPAIIAEQYYESLRLKGLEVDLLLKEPDPNHPEYMSVVKAGYSKRLIVRMRRAILLLLARLRRGQNNYVFCYGKEIHPPVPTRLILKKIIKHYELVIIIFWQDMLSFETINGIYDKLHCQIQFIGVDYSHMSGGCHFTNDCQRYKEGCGLCPALTIKSQNDFTSWNVKYRKKVYEKAKPIVYGNQYMMDFYKQSYLLKNANCELLKSAIIDTDVFRPINDKGLREKYHISKDKKFVILYASQVLTDERKGVKYFVDSLHILYDSLKEKSTQVLVLLVGKNYEAIKELIPFDSKGLGYVPMEQLPELYSLASFYVCSSINDAGPMMVNQSLCCGTPVVGFEMGAVKELVKGNECGVCVKLKDTQALAEGMKTIIEQTDEGYKRMSEQARNVALGVCSFEASANIILSNYYKYRNLL